MKLKNRGNPCLQGKVKAMWSDTLAAPWSQHWGVCVQFAFVRFVISDPPTLLFHNQRVMFTTNFMPFYLVSWKWFYLTRRRKFVLFQLIFHVIYLLICFTLQPTWKMASTVDQQWAGPEPQQGWMNLPTKRRWCWVTPPGLTPTIPKITPSFLHCYQIRPALLNLQHASRSTSL